MVMEKYFKDLRNKIGPDEIIMPGVAGVLFNNDRSAVLMETRSDGEVGYSLIGGMQNLGESAIETMIREFKEEVGLDVEIVDLIGVDTNFHHTFPNGDKAQIPSFIFEVQAVGGDLKVDGDEVLDVQFIELANKPFMYNSQHQKVVNKLIAGEDYGWYE